MSAIKYENQTVFEKYQNLILNESKKGLRRKAQLIEDRIDDFVDEIEKKIEKIDENPTFQTKMFQMLADMNKEHAEFVMALKTVCATLDSGAKVMPKTKPTAKQNRPEEPEQQEPEPEQDEAVNEK